MHLSEQRAYALVQAYFHRVHKSTWLVRIHLGRLVGIHINHLVLCGVTAWLQSTMSYDRSPGLCVLRVHYEKIKEKQAFIKMVGWLINLDEISDVCRSKWSWQVFLDKIKSWSVVSLTIMAILHWKEITSLENLQKGYFVNLGCGAGVGFVRSRRFLGGVGVGFLTTVEVGVVRCRSRTFWSDSGYQIGSFFTSHS